MLCYFKERRSHTLPARVPYHSYRQIRAPNNARLDDDFDVIVDYIADVIRTIDARLTDRWVVLLINAVCADGGMHVAHRYSQQATPRDHRRAKHVISNRCVYLVNYVMCHNG